jgi:hypothetical protein
MHVVDLHCIVPVYISHEKCVEQVEAKHFPSLDSYKDMQRLDKRLKLVRALDFFILRKELFVIF